MSCECQRPGVGDDCPCECHDPNSAKYHLHKGEMVHPLGSLRAADLLNKWVDSLNKKLGGDF
jgi:hypothetical protein